MAKGLTDRQREIYDFLIEYARERGYPPTLREICREFGMASTRAASDHLVALERKGYIERSPDKSRAIHFPKNATDKPGRTLDVVGRVAAGTPMHAEENIVDRFTLDESLVRGEECFMLDVEGESMIGVHICPGDRIIVRKQEEARDGDIVVALLGEEATVKRFEKKGGRIRLLPENPDMDPIPVPDPSELRIQGIVIGLVRDIR